MPAQKTEKSHSRNALKIYFLLTTLAGVIWTLVSAWFLIYTIGKKVIITNNEYIIWERYYDLDTCTQNVQATTNTTPVAAPTLGNNYVAPTDAQIAKCKADKTIQLIAAREVLFKEDLLNGAIRTILFLILLLTHYPRFMRLNKKD